MLKMKQFNMYRDFRFTSVLKHVKFFFVVIVRVRVYYDDFFVFFVSCHW